MQGYQGVIDQALEEFMKQIGIEVTDARPSEINIENQTGASGQVDDDT